VALRAGQRLRVAIEGRDEKAALAAWEERVHAKAKRGGYETDDAFSRFSEEDVAQSWVFSEPDTLGLSSEQVREIRTALSLRQILGTNAHEGVLAVLLVGPTPEWSAFEIERASWASAKDHPDMWPDILIERQSDPSWRPPSLTSLSFDARQVLTYPKLVTRRMAVSTQFLTERSLLPDDRLAQAILERKTAGLASAPVLHDLIMTLTSEQLKTALVDLGEVPRGAKESLARGLEAVDSSDLTDYLAAHHPVALELEWTVGIGAGKAARWDAEFATLIGHWLYFSLSTSAKLAGRGRMTYILKTDDCAVCHHPQKKLPPFHIGCRCTWG
jgi:hypothetical protein